MDNENLSPSSEKQEELLLTLQARFETNMPRHEGLVWEDVKRKLSLHNEKLKILFKMEATGGEPDVAFYDKDKDEYLFFDCAAESPMGRRNLCYDREALEKRRDHKPHNTAVDMAREMGIGLLTEEQYRALQKLGKFDAKTSSWIKTPDHIRTLGGAIFCDRRYDTVFVYHNGAESYYSSRGFRGFLAV